MGAGTWERLIPEDVRRILIANAPTFLDETRDPEILSIEASALPEVQTPVLLGGSSDSPQFFGLILDRLEALLPNARRRTFEGASHIVHFTHPQEYAQAITEFIEGQSAATP